MRFTFEQQHGPSWTRTAVIDFFFFFFFLPGRPFSPSWNSICFWQETCVVAVRSWADKIGGRLCSLWALEIVWTAGRWRRRWRRGGRSRDLCPKRRARHRCSFFLFLNRLRLRQGRWLAVSFWFFFLFWSAWIAVGRSFSEAVRHSQPQLVFYCQDEAQELPCPEMEKRKHKPHQLRPIAVI